MVNKITSQLKKLTGSPKAKMVAGLIVIAIMVVTLLSMRKTLIVNIDGKETTITTYKGNVKAALQDNNITVGQKDKITPGLSTELSRTGRVNIHRAVNVSISVDGQTTHVASAEKTVADMLKAEGVILGDKDKIEPVKETEITKDTSVKITRVDSKIVKEESKLDYETVIQTDDNLDKSVSKTITEGECGSKETTYMLTLEDGKEVKRTVVAQKVTKKPVNKVIKKGTAETVTLSRGESTVYKKKMNMVATAYAIHGGTASGATTVRNPNGLSTIAVDPNVIPLGTKVYVPGYGLAVAQDTGSAIKNNKIDLFMNTSSEAYNWGVRNVEVYIIAYPGQW